MLQELAVPVALQPWRREILQTSAELVAQRHGQSTCFARQLLIRTAPGVARLTLEGGEIQVKLRVTTSTI